MCASVSPSRASNSSCASRTASRGPPSKIDIFKIGWVSGSSASHAPTRASRPREPAASATVLSPPSRSPSRGSTTATFNLRPIACFTALANANPTTPAPATRMSWTRGAVSGRALTAAVMRALSAGKGARASGCEDASRVTGLIGPHPRKAADRSPVFDRKAQVCRVITWKPQRSLRLGRRGVTRSVTARPTRTPASPVAGRRFVAPWPGSDRTSAFDHDLHAQTISVRWE
jgi:hypothetical protein